MRNPYLCIIIVAALSLGGLAGTGGLIILACYSRTAPESLVAITSGCFSALASFLVQPPRGSVGIGRGGRQVVHAERTTVTNSGVSP